MMTPTVSPHDSNLVVEHCDMTGGYITHDGGQSWRMFNLRALIETFAFDPRDSKVIYAGNAALWRSEDSGRSWRMVYPNPSANTVEHQNGDHSDVSLTTDDKSYPAGRRITSIVIDSEDPKRIDLVFSAWRGGALILASTDRGESFRPEKEIADDRILLLHRTADSLVAVGVKAVYVRTDETWASHPVPPDETLARVSSGEAGGTTYLYATTEKGALFVSEDRGRTWHSKTPQLGQQSGRFEAVATSARNAKVAYTGFRELKLGRSP